MNKKHFFIRLMIFVFCCLFWGVHSVFATVFGTNCDWSVTSGQLLIKPATGYSSCTLPSFARNDYQPWDSLKTSITSVYVQATVYANADSSHLFSGLLKAKTINLANLNTSNTTNMYGLFYNCLVLTSLDLSKFNTSKVTNMADMFFYCSSLKSVNLTSFDTSKVTNMDYMFAGCESLTSLNITNFNTSNVVSMISTFLRCSTLTSIDVSKFNTSKVTAMGGLFEECSSLISLNLSNFNTANVTDMWGMFYGCTSLANLNISSFNTSKATDVGWMFKDCTSLSSLNLGNFNLPNVTSEYFGSSFDNDNMGINFSYYYSNQKGTMLYYYNKYSYADFGSKTDLTSNPSNIVFKPYEITKSVGSNGTMAISSTKYASSVYQTYFAKTASFYTSTAPTYNSSKTYAQSGESVTLTITPQAGYEINTFTIDGANYKSQISGNKYTLANIKANHNIIVTFKISVISKSIKKIWNDDMNRDGLRTSSVRIQVKANATPVGTPIVLNESNNWKLEINNLPSSNNGTPIAYSVEELTSTPTP